MIDGAITDLQPSAPEVHRPWCKSSFICASVCLCARSVSECTGCVCAWIIDYIGRVAPTSDSCPPEATWGEWVWKRQENRARPEQLWTCQNEYEPLISGIFSFWMCNCWLATGCLSHPSKWHLLIIVRILKMIYKNILSKRTWYLIK